MTTTKDYSQDGITYRVRTTDHGPYKTMIVEIITVDGKEFAGDAKYPAMTRLVMRKDEDTN